MSIFDIMLAVPYIRDMTLNVSLTPQLEDMVKTKVSSGLYNSASELVREALRLLDERDQFRGMQLEKLRREIQLGADSGPGIPAEEVFAELRQIVAEATARAQ